MLYGEIYRAVRSVLLQARKDASLSQVNLAEKLGKGQSYVSKIEKGEQYIDLVEFLLWCEACEAQTNQLIEKIIEVVNKAKAP